MSVSDADLVLMLHDLCEQYVIKDIQPDEFTARMFARQNDIPWARANKALRRAAQDGVLRAIGKRREPDGIVSEAYVRNTPGKA